MATMIIAAYAAIVATSALGWEIYKWRQTHTTKVRVKLSNAFLTPSFQRVVSVDAVNDNGHSIRSTSWGLEANDGSDNNLVIIEPLNGSTLPGPIAAHDSGCGFSDFDTIDQMQQIDFKRPVVAFVNLASGERICSKPTTLAA